MQKRSCASSPNSIKEKQNAKGKETGRKKTKEKGEEK